MFDNGLDFLKAHPRESVIVGGAVAGALLFINLRKPASTSEDGTGNGSNSGSGTGTGNVTNPLGGTQPGTIGGVAYIDRVKEVKKPSAKGILQVVRLDSQNNPFISTYKKLTDPTKSCPPGYELIVSSNGKPRCAALDERDVKNKGQLTEAPKPVTKTATGGKAGEFEPLRTPTGSFLPTGFVDPLTIRHTMQPHTDSYVSDWG